MKLLALTSLVIGLAGCLSHKELPVEYDYSFKGRFDKYKTYDFLSANEFHGEDTLLIQSSIEQHMKFLGYKKKKNKPDLYLNYAIYEDRLNFRGYDQPDINQWVKRKETDIEYKNHRLDLHNGTLLIQVYDRRINSAIWQGYATNNYQKLDFHNYQQVRNAVKSILNKYQFFANGYIEERMKKTEIIN